MSFSPLAVFFYTTTPPPRSTLFPYTTLFRSERGFTQLEYQLNDYPGPTKTALFGIQHVLVMFTAMVGGPLIIAVNIDRKSTRLNSSHANISYAVFCLKKKTNTSN